MARHCSIAFCALAPVLGQAGDLRHEGGPLRPGAHGALRLGEDRGEARVLAPPAAPLTEEREHARVRRLELAHALEPGLGGLGPSADAPVHHGDLQRGAELFLLAAQRSRGELPLVQSDEVLPHLERGEVFGEEARSPLRVRASDSSTCS